MNIDNIKVSSYVMSTIGAVLGGFIFAILQNPQLLQTLMGEYYFGIYGLLTITILGIVYNVVFKGETPIEE
jgi:hypothetical protein